VIATGGAKGVVTAITRALAQERAVPVIPDRDTPAAESLQAELSRDGSFSHSIQIDPCSPVGCAAAIEPTLSVANRLHASVNNAGVNDSVSLEKRGPEEFAALLRRNLLHYYNMAHDALPSLKAATRAFVNIASKVAFTGRGDASVYAASKGTILALTGEWAAAPLPGGVRVNRAGPAEGMTPLYRQWLDTIQNPNEKRAAVVANFPPGKRRTAAEEIAATTVFLVPPNLGIQPVSRSSWTVVMSTWTVA
jgi:L-fucose dehydrogenase